MQITFDTTNPQDLHILETLFSNLNLPANGKAQSEVARNTDSTATGSNPLPEGSGVSGEAASATAAASPAPEKKTRVKKEKVTEASAPVDETAGEPTAAVAEASTKPLSLDEVRAALQSFTASKGVPAGIELLKEFGAGRISELDAGKYTDFVAKCEVAA